MSFRLKIILGLVVIQLLLLVMLVWSSLNFLRGSNEVELSNRASAIAEILASTLEDKLLSGDHAGLLEHIREILGLPGTVYVRILDRSGTVAAQGGEATVLGRPFVEDFLFEDVNDGVYDVSADIVRGGETIGRVQLGVTVRSISTIMDAARRAGLELGGRVMWLSVWEQNPRAIAFYAKVGFRDVGSADFHVGSDRQTDRILVTALDGSRSAGGS